MDGRNGFRTRRLLALCLILVAGPALAAGVIATKTPVVQGTAPSGSCNVATAPPVFVAGTLELWRCNAGIWTRQDLPPCPASPPSGACSGDAVCKDLGSLYVCNGTWQQITGGGGGGAPTGAPYVTSATDATLTNERVLSAGTNTTIDTGTAGQIKVNVASATTGAVGVVQLAGDLAGTATVPTIAANAVALTTDTTGSYVASVATTAPLTGGAAGSEGAALTLGFSVASEAQGDLLMRGSSTWGRFADSGTGGQCLLSGGTGADPAWGSCPGGGGGAPTGAQYVTLATDATLSAERTLAAGAGLAATDGGAGGAYTLATASLEPGFLAEDSFVSCANTDDGKAFIWPNASGGLLSWCPYDGAGAASFRTAANGDASGNATGLACTACVDIQTEATGWPLDASKGGTGQTTANADSVLHGGTGAGPWQQLAIPNCTGTTNKLTYLTSTHAFGCETDQTGGGGGNSFTTMDAPAGTDPAADSATDTLALAATAPLTITGNSTTDTLTFAVSDATAGATGVVQLAGDLAGTAASPAIAANAVALTTDTTGNYVAGLTAGAGISVTGSAGEGWSPTVATNSNSTGFLATSALTCGAGTAGRASIATTVTTYCDNSATPTQRYGALGDSSGNATGLACTDCATLGTETAGSYVASVATTAPLSGGAAGSEGAALTLSVANATTGAVGVVQLAGDLAGTATAPTVAADAVTLATDTTGAYVANMSGSGPVTASGGGAENATVTVGLTTGTGADAAGTLTLHDLISGAASNGQVPQWNGTNWFPATAGGGGTSTLWHVTLLDPASTLDLRICDGTNATCLVGPRMPADKTVSSFHCILDPGSGSGYTANVTLYECLMSGASWTCTASGGTLVSTLTTVDADGQDGGALSNVVESGRFLALDINSVSNAAANQLVCDVGGN